MPKLRIVFMGTPEFAVASLDALRKDGHDIVGVITAPDKPAGRGKKIHASAVKKYAEVNELNILQPAKLKDEVFLQELSALKADLFVVVAFRMLPEVVWAMPPKGTINLHASLLPQYRGAAPINWAIINGDKVSGVSTFFIEKEIDTGKVIQQTEVEIGDYDTAGDLHDNLMQVGAETLLETVNKIAAGEAKAIDQSLMNLKELKLAPKIFKEDCKIDWNKGAEKIFNLIRGMSPYPTAHTEICNAEGEKFSMKVFQADYALCSHNNVNGVQESDKKTFLRYYTSDGYVEIKELQIAGKKRMLISDFLRGFSL